MLRLGASKPWQDAMEAMTGQRDVLATPLLNYFEPLRVWLEAKNKENGDYVGWDLPADMKKEPVAAPKVNRIVKDEAAPKISKETAKILAPIFTEALHTLQKIRLWWIRWEKPNILRDDDLNAITTGKSR